MKYIELFAGVGGFRRGLEPLGHECVGWVERDKFARKSYEAIWPEARDEWNATDITSVTDDDLRRLSGNVGEIDIIAGGFPCQAFSVAGKRGGFEDTRGTLFFEVARFAMVLRPKYLLLENVVGLLNHDQGRTFYTILCALDELGYDVEWQVFNATAFAIPQNRERVFLVGHSRSRGGRKIFPLDIANSEAHCVLAGRLALPGKDQWNQVYSPTGHSPTLTTMQGGRQEPMVFVSAVLTPDREKKRQIGRRVKEPDEPMFTLTAQDKHGVLVTRKGVGEDAEWTKRETATCLDANYYKGLYAHQARTGVSDGTRIRKLTPLECWRLMGREDWEFERAKYLTVEEAEKYIAAHKREWKRDIPDSTRIERMSDSQLYKQAGNSLVSQIVEAIARRLS